MYFEEKGAYTGEISPLMLQGLCEYVILGHSERRAYFGETDELVNRKAQAAFAHDLRPIVCVGEQLEERDADRTERVLDRQVRGSLANLPAERLDELVVAYEPVWAIGTGRAATATGRRRCRRADPRAARRDVRRGCGRRRAHAVRRQRDGGQRGASSPRCPTSTARWSAAPASSPSSSKSCARPPALKASNLR